MEAADRELFERSLRHATEHHSGADLDAALDQMGWHDALVDDGRVAVSLLFELAGSVNAACGALDLVLLASLRGKDKTRAGGVVLPAPGRSTPPGQIQEGRLHIAGLGTATTARSDYALVAARDGGHHVTVIVPTVQLTLTPVLGLDPSLGLVHVGGDGLALTASPTPLDGWSDAVAAAQVALGHELVGVSRAMLSFACAHALERIQFDHPIATFQAIRHRLADTLVAIETADAALGAAWDDPSPQSAAMAKSLAGRGARTAARHCQQVLAGIGFTTEHPLHRYVRRALVLDELFGSTRTLTRQLGDDVLADSRLPRPLPL
jgi:hypothetical protein